MSAIRRNLPALRSRRGLRTRLWAFGVVAGLCYYGYAADVPARRTGVGIERRLFGLGQLHVTTDLGPRLRLIESPDGTRWLLAPNNGTASPAGLIGSDTAFWNNVESFVWAPDAAPSRQLAPLQIQGSWLIEGTRLRRVWSVVATGWAGDDEHLFGSWGSRAEGTLAEGTLDLRRSRVRRGPSEAETDGGAPYPSEEYPGLEWDSLNDDTETTLRSDMDGWNPNLAPNSRQSHVTIGERSVTLVAWEAHLDEQQDIYAIGDQAAARMTKLVSGAWPVAIGRDGRVLFFEREGALWRLDLHRPLPQLLDEVPVPNLPDPLLTGMRKSP